MTLARNIDKAKSVEQLEGVCWTEPAKFATSMVEAVYLLRKRPVGELAPHELARLISQNIGLPWLIPIALDYLRETAPSEAAGGFYDDDLLGAVITRNKAWWVTMPEYVTHLKETVEMLTDIGQYLKDDIDQFISTLATGE
ncbi:contact-dependent growth inhibition system immunity protein [Nocardia sp. NPDC052566]|uniref:contact-dependent growth inhibition system immunity protein n=1 Tax=Nocardia sp. NPDC052566 TaxID=3364330 RepID=UPI0037C54053